MSEEGISIDLTKVEAVMRWERPKSVFEIRSFLGLASYYHRFIENFSRIVCPITRLTRKGVSFDWNNKCEESFQELKRRLTTSPMLTRFSSLFSLECESCQLGKHTRVSFPKHLESQTKSRFELVHTDVWGSSRTASTFSFRYFVTFIDDFFYCTWLFLMKS